MPADGVSPFGISNQTVFTKEPSATINLTASVGNRSSLIGYFRVQELRNVETGAGRGSGEMALLTAKPRFQGKCLDEITV